MEIGEVGSLVMEKLETWIEAAIKMLPNILLAALIISVFYFLAKVSKGPLQKLFSKFSDNDTVASLFGKTLAFFIFAFGLFMALSVMQLEKAVTSLLAGAGVIGLALGFAFQEIASNFVSGILISFQKPYRVGDIVQINDYTGTVKRLDLRVTVIRTFQGLEVLMPNKEMYTNALVNYTLTSDRRIDFECGVSYGEDLEKVEKVAKEALESVRGREIKKDIEIFFKEFGGSSINFVAQVWIEYPGQGNYWKARHDIVTKIKKAFDENDINIPFPIRTLDFGIKGGEALREELTVFKKSSNKTLQ